MTKCYFLTAKCNI